MVKKRWVFALLLVILVSLAYFSYLSGGFVLDDVALVLNSQILSAKEPTSSVFVTSLYKQPYTYRPLQVLSYIFDHKIWSYDPFGFHLTNIIIHSVNAILVYYLLSLLAPLYLAEIASILFAVHPVNSSVVGYVSARADLLVFFFMFLSAVFFVKFLKSNLKIYYFLSLISGVSAFFCRENSLLLFLFIFLLGLASQVNLKRSFKLTLPFLSCTFLYIIIYHFFSVKARAGLFPVHLPALFILLNFLYIVLNYIIILFFPLNLHMFRSSVFILNLSDLRILAVALFLVLCVLIFCRFRENKPFLLGLIWFIIGLMPAAFLLNRYPWLKRAMMAESWLYLPAAGFFLAVAVVVNKLGRAGKLIFCCYIVLCVYLTSQQHIYWRENLVAYENMMKYLPEANPVRRNLIRVYLERGLYDKALAQLRIFSKAYPVSSLSYELEGDYYKAVKEPLKAKESYKKALIFDWRNREIIEKINNIEVENGK